MMNTSHSRGNMNMKKSLNKMMMESTPIPSMNKSNVTLWKNQNYSNVNTHEEDKKVENDYIDNLKKQVYFMEMELKLMKEREREIEKTGGFSKYIK
jgi:hypothetical protein